MCRLFVRERILDELGLAKSCAHESDAEWQAGGGLNDGCCGRRVDRIRLEAERHYMGSRRSNQSDMQYQTKDTDRSPADIRR